MNEDATAVHQRLGLIDLHVDFVIQNRLFGYRPERRHGPGWRGQPLFNHCDLPRMADAAYGGACLGVHYFPWQSERGWRAALRQMDYIDTLAARDDVLRVREAGDWDLARAQQRIGIAVGVEGAHILNGRLERVEELRRRDVMYLTLAHFSRNDAVSPSMGLGANRARGLTGFGRELVQTLNGAGIAIDVAHVSAAGVLEACALSTAPVLCTHTGARAVHDSPRNLDDEGIDAVVSTGGAIGVIFGPIFLSGRLRAPTTCVADHVDYLVDRAGINHVAIGTDYDGWLPSIPNDQRDCRDLVVLTQELLRRGYTEGQLRRLYRENAVRVHGAVRAAGLLS